MSNTNLTTHNPSSTPVGTETALDMVIANAGGTTLASVEATLLNNIVEASPVTITGDEFVLDGEGLTLTGSSAKPALVVASNSEIFVGDLNINDGGAGAISIGVGGQVNFLPAATPPTGATNIGIIAGVISGGGAVAVGAAGDTTLDKPLVLSAANTYTGSTTIYDAVDLGINGSIADSSAVDLALAQSVLDISGAQTSAGAPTTVTVNDLSGLGTVYLGLNSLVIVANASTMFYGTIADSSGYTTSGKVTISAAAGDSFTITAPEQYTGSTTITSGTLALSGQFASIAKSSNVSLKAAGATLDVSGVTNGNNPLTVNINELTGVAGTAVKIGGDTLAVDEDVTAATFSGVISDGGNVGALTLSGPYELSLAGVNTYTGVTTIDTGATLGITGAGSIADSSGVTDQGGAGGNLDISGASGPVTINNLDTSGKVTLGANTLVFAGAGGSLGGVISGTGSVQVGTATTAGDLGTAAANIYTGATKIYGDLTLGVGGSIADSSNVSLKLSGAELITDGAQTIHELTGVANTGVSLGGNLTVIENVTAATFSGEIQSGVDTYGLELATTPTGGAYTLTLTAAQDYLGATVIDKGASLALSGAGDISSSDAVIDNGVLNISGASNAGAAEVLTLIDFSGAGSLVLGSNGADLDELSNTTFSGVISGAGGIEIDNATLTLTGANTYTGVTVIDGGTLELGAALASSAIADSGVLQIGGVTGVSAITVSQVISDGQNGGGSVTIANGTHAAPFTATLTGADTYTGQTTIAGEYATLVLSGAGSIADSGGVFNEGGTIDISQANGPIVLIGYTDYDTSTAKFLLGANTVEFAPYGLSSSIGGVISGTGAVEVLSGADVNFYGVQAYTGATKIYGDVVIDSAGSVAASSNISLQGSNAYFNVSFFQESAQTPAVDINTLTGVTGSEVYLGSNTLDVTQNTAASFSGEIYGANGDLILDGTATLTLAGGNSYTGSTTIDKGASLALSGTMGSIASSASVTDNGALSISGVVATGGGIHPPPATVVLTDFSGAGSLVLGANTADLEDGFATVMGNQVPYDFTGSISGSGGIALIGGPGALDLSGSLTYTGATAIGAGETLYLGAALASSGIADSGTLDIGDGGVSSLSLSQVITGSGAVDVTNGTKADPFTATLSGASTYAGATVVGEYNTLALTKAGSINGSASVSNEGAIDISGASGPITLSHYSDSNLLGPDGSLILGANTVIFGGATTVVGGGISGTGSVQIAAGDVATVSSDLLYTGATKVYGTLDIDIAGAVSDSSNVSLKASGADFDISGIGTGVTADINTLTGVAGTTVVLGANTLDVTQTTAATFSGVISGNGGLTLDAASTAALTLANVETYAGPTIDDGSLILGAHGSIAGTGALTVNGSLTISAAASVDNLSGASTGTVNLGSFALTDLIDSASIHDTFAGVITGSGSLTAAGFVYIPATPVAEPGSPQTAGETSSVLTLSHASTFTGGITIQGGTVEIAAAGAAGTGEISFADTSTTTAIDAGVLVIDNAALTGSGTASESFANTIGGVSGQDIIDLSGLAFDTVPGQGQGGSLVFNSATDQLLVTEGSVTVALTIAGLNATSVSSYHLYEDAHGGTFLTQLTPTDTTHYHP